MKKDYEILDYNHKNIEKKWQDLWEEKNSFFTDLNDFSRPKKYVLSMFPYPSGSGLHVGHVRNYTISDALARFYRLLGFNVLFPIGWDSFGLPSEQYAIKTNNHPSTFTFQNVSKFKQQLKSLGFSYDWSKEIDTSDPAYYSLTQWMFKRIIIENLAVYKDYPVFWCESLGTVLSNEEVKIVDSNKFASEREGFSVEKKNIKQWIVKITDYSKDLLKGLEGLDWPLNIKKLQKDWIGIVEGVKVLFPVVGKNFSIEVFTTRVDTIYGVNSIVVSPSNKLLESVIAEDKRTEFLNFTRKWKDIFVYDQEKMDSFFTGSYCLNPINNEKVPIWTSNFVSNEYGTGCLMISPFGSEIIKNHRCQGFATKKEISQNERVDNYFSITKNLPIKEIAFFDKESKNYKYKNSDLINNSPNKKEAIEKLTLFLEEKNFGKRLFVSHLKDWVFSRQRYWGEPIPVVHLNENKIFLIPDEDLPLKLPFLNNFKPSQEFYSPLQKAKDWVSFDKNGIIGTRDFNVMPQWAGSCWYYISFLLKKKDFYLKIYSEEAKKIIDYWMPVDIYIGGQEHANLHLLYARFWNMFLNNKSIISHREPFKKLFCQGMIMSSDGSKMSKSKGNVVNPDYCVEKWGADSLRMYEIFISPPSQSANFDISRISPMKSWLNKVYSFFKNEVFFDFQKKSNNIEVLDFLINKIVEDYHSLKLNLIVSSLMIFMKNFQKICKERKIPFSYGKIFLQFLSTLAPHLAEEIWSNFKIKGGENNFLSLTNLDLKSFSLDCNNSVFKILVQVNNKFKGIISIESNQNSQEEVLKILKEQNFIQEKKEVLKVFFSSGKMINVLTN